MQENKDVAAGPVEMTQGDSGWTSSVKGESIGGVEVNDTNIPSSGNVYVNVSKSGTVTFKDAAETGYAVVNPVNGSTSS